MNPKSTRFGLDFFDLPADFVYPFNSRFRRSLVSVFAPGNLLAAKVPFFFKKLVAIASLTE